MFFFKRKPAETPRAASSLPPPDEVPHVHDAEKVLSLAQVLSQQSDFQEMIFSPAAVNSEHKSQKNLGDQPPAEGGPIPWP